MVLHHFIIKELAENFEGQFECLGGNKKKYISFPVLIKKELENNKTIAYTIKFTDNVRFMSSLLSSPANNLAEGLHNDKCTDYKFYLEYISTKDELLIFNCPKCSKNHLKHFNENLIKRFTNTYEFCDGDINKFRLMLRKGVYLCEYMNGSKRFDETLLPDNEDFYSNLNIEEITDTVYKHPRKSTETL